MRGTFITCSDCGQTQAWGKPTHWKAWKHKVKGCNGKPVVTIQATGCRHAKSLYALFLEIEQHGYEASRVMMDMEDYEHLNGIIWNTEDHDASFWGARVILNGYLITIEEQEEGEQVNRVSGG